MAIERGKLVLSNKGKPQVQYTSKKGKLVTANPATGEISRTIMERLKELNGVEVEFEMEGGQPRRIREVGSDFVPTSTSAAPAGRSRQGDRSGYWRQQSTGRPDTVGRDFHNPYNFIPAPPRKTDDPDLGDHEPVAQDRFHQDRITGCIRVEMEAITPLLVPDPNTCREDDNGHKTFALPLGSDGKPLIPSSSIRGMLRSAYEAVTNSRFGRFDHEHKKRLAYRMEAKEGLRLIPARIEHGQVHLLTGTSAVGTNGAPNGPQYAAWLPRYSGRNKSTNQALRYSDGTLPQHGDEVECWVELVQHHRWDKKSEQHVSDFRYWVVRAITKVGGSLPSKSPSVPAGLKQDRGSWHEPQGVTKNIHGWVCITNANINRKHDERVFFIDGKPRSFPLTDELQEQWKELIENYQEIHAEDLEKRRRNRQGFDAYLGSDPGQTAWSRHVYTQEDRELRDGTLCYARLTRDSSAVEALFPVMIARELYPVSPWDLLDPSLRPASSIGELSPADRVFGWVRMDSGDKGGEQKDSPAVRGLLRIGPVTCESSAEESVETFPGDGLPLAILAAPKPQQGRFYVAASSNGEAQRDGLSKAEAGYSLGKGLRGRKVYPHHGGLPAGYWENPLEDPTNNPQSPSQEYRRPRKDRQEQRDDQNRSILGWVKPGARFAFDIHVSNLSKVELGALLFLLQLPEGRYHRFGGGKPLGFGSVRLEISDCTLRTGQALGERYRSWKSQGSPEDIPSDAVKAFKEAVVRAYGQAASGSFEQVSFIEAFLKACKGFDDRLPVHYPRVTKQPSEDGESYRWFLANEKDGARFALANLAHDKGLPIIQDPPSFGRKT
ncbi:CRISPR-associated protein [Desulfacinum infernum DSM 9756]|uniref:CRISPR-associated protein n=1 Tax=Desulfacinum infernum DSM 9756 TaxID=1121391 RepID=A0A1M5ATL4_9BACT|nr:TIGR03986 family CRISPR-associated RAMP protein [Desulfacinum infernum]SHF33534.1 CRISPR-associated protein [Desulfacinum infernum DSM 9756]